MQSAEREQGIIRVIVGLLASFYLYSLHHVPGVSGIPLSAHSMILPVNAYTIPEFRFRIGSNPLGRLWGDIF
jgi:two-component system sensor histidine kinase RpfC